MSDARSYETTESQRAYWRTTLLLAQGDQERIDRELMRLTQESVGIAETIKGIRRMLELPLVGVPVDQEAQE